MALIGDENVLRELLGKETEMSVTKDQFMLHKLGEGKISQTLTIIPEEYWGLYCWEFPQ